MFARTTAAALALVLTSASAAGAQTAEPTIVDNGVGDAVVVPLNKSIPSIDAGDTQWIALNWTSLNASARNLKVTAVGSDGVTVEYPEFSLNEDPNDHTNNGYSSGFSDSTLSESEIDYTALKLTVDQDVTGPMALKVTVSYESETGSHVNQHEMPIGDDGDDGIVPVSTTPALPACDLIAIDSFLHAPWTFTFQVRNKTSAPLDFQFVIPDANYKIDNLKFNGSSQNVVLDQVANGDGTYTITVEGELPAWKSVGGQQSNGFKGKITPTSGEPFVRCA